MQSRVLFQASWRAAICPILFGLFTLTQVPVVLAQAAQGTAAAQTQRGTETERQAQEREQQRQQQLQPSPNVRLTAQTVPARTSRLSDTEQPCFCIENIVINGTEDTRIDTWALLTALKGPARDDAPQGRCLGAQGIALLIGRAQDQLIEQGYITSRILAPEQDLSGAKLQLQVLPGRIERIRLSRGDNRATLENALPMRAGQVLQLRDIEQALENLKRVPTVESEIQIEPGQQPGGSDLVVNWRQSKPLRLSLNADDSGSPSSGKYQSAVTMSYDHALALNDLLYVTTSRDLGGGERGYRGTRGVSAHYSIPFGYWLLSLNSNRNRYFQTVYGAAQEYLYSGSSAQQEIKLTHLFARDAASKTSWSLKAFARQSQNFIDDTEIEVQRRRVGGYELGLQHKTQRGVWQIDAALAYKRGTKAFRANEAPEEFFGEGTHQFELWAADMQWQAPFNIGRQSWQYQGSWRWQNNRTPLTPQDHFSIGGRYSVRGFDGQNSLSGERGWLLRNEWSTTLASTSQRLYFGLDHGRVSGASTENLLGRRLTGLVVGLRGLIRGLQYEVFASRALDKPQGFKTARPVLGMHIWAQF